MLLIGNGNLGSAVLAQLRERCEEIQVIVAGRTASGEGTVSLDISDIESVKCLDEKIPGGVDHVVVCCGALMS